MRFSPSDQKKMSKVFVSFKDEDEYHSLHGEIDKQGLLERLLIQNSEEPITNKVKGLSLDKLPHLFSEKEKGSLMPSTFILARWMQMEYEGIPSLKYLLGVQGDQLVCRCFGVFLSRIVELVWNTPCSLKDITDKLKAGGGCTRCHKDLKKILLPSIITPVKLAREIDELKKKWLARNHPSVQMDIMSIDKNKIVFSVEPSDEKYLISFSHHLDGFFPGMQLVLMDDRP